MLNEVVPAFIFQRTRIVNAPPMHGSIAFTGEVVTYTPAAGYYGADKFTYTATGPNGTSAPASVTVTVANPPAPRRARDADSTLNSAGTPLDLSSKIAGVATGIGITTAPAHGTLTSNGEVVTYVPAAGYIGSDSFAYAATGPGGTSAAASVAVTVTAPPAPTAANAVAAVAYNSPGTLIDLSAKITGVTNSVAISAQPAHGRAAISGSVVTYAPAAGYFGADSFSFTATGPGGTSAPATITLTVATPPAPTVTTRT